MAFTFLLALSCEKTDVSNSCRLTEYDYYDGLGEFHNTENFTYKNGSLDNVFTNYGYRFNMVYNAQNKLIGSTAYDGQTLVYVISFMYKNNKVVQEIWRDATTQEIYDQVFLTYDQKGNLVRSESFILDYYTVNTYTTNGNLKSWQVVDHGLNFAKAEYTYEDNYKNPYSSIKDVDHAFWYTNSAFGIRTGQRWYSSEKVTLYDESNQPYVYYEQDPYRTTWQTGQQNYPLQAEYVDLNTASIIRNSFNYDCNNGASSPVENIKQRTTPINKQASSNKLILEE